MRCLQIEYTSCRLGEHAGFQVRAASPDAEAVLGQGDMDEVIRLGLYRPPLADGTAPVAFRAARLLSGRQVLQHSRYLGLDDTGREGNFRTRSLVAVDPEAALPLWAVEYYEWAGWQNKNLWNENQRLESEGARSWHQNDIHDATRPLHLPGVDLGTVPGGDSFACHELCLFLREHQSRPAWLMAMLMSLFRPPAHRRLVIRDEKENNPYWLACLTRLLPRPVANSLNISTCQPEFQGFDLAAIPLHCEAPAALLCEPSSTLPPPTGNVPRTGQIYARKSVDLLLRTPESVAGFLHGIDGFIKPK